MSRDSRTLVLEYWLPLLLWIGAIHFFSTDVFSGAQTSRFIVPLLQFLFPGISAEGIEAWHGAIRKSSHLAEYFILAVLAYRSFRFTEREPGRARLLSGAFVVLVAISDEVHQLMTISRSGSIIDVGYDTLGAVWALGLAKFHETRHLRPHSVL